MARKKASPQDVALEVVCNIGRAVAAEMDLASLLELIYQETGRVMDAQCFAVALYDALEEGLRYELLYDRGERLPPRLLRRQEGWGLAGRAFEQRTSMFFDDLQAEPLPEGAVPVGDVPRSWMGVPLIAHEQTVGVISVQSYEPHAFSAADHRLLEAIASQSAVAVENLSLRQDQERRIAELSTLTEISRAVSSPVGLDDLLATVFQQVSRVFDTTNFYIGTYDEARGDWIVSFSREHGQADPEVGSRYRVTAGLSGYIIRSRQALILNTVAESNAFHEGQGIPAIGERACSWMGVPLLAADKIVGVMAIQSYSQENLYRVQDLTLFSTIATQVAAAVANARLFQELQGRLADLSVLNEVSQAILVAESEDELLEAIHGQVRRVVDTTNFYVALYDEGRQLLDFAYFVEDGKQTPRRYNQIGAGGLTAHIVLSREPLYLDEDADAQLQARGIAGRGRPAKSYLGVPMIVGDQVVGAMAVQSYEREHAFTPRHLALFSNLATQAALAIQRVRLRGSESRKARQLATIGDVSRKVTAVLDLDELLRELARAIQLGFGHANVAVFRVEEEAQELVLGALVGRYAGIMDWGYRQPIGEGLPGWAAQHSQTVLCGDVTEEPRYVRGFDAEELTRSEMCVPITYGNRVTGVLDIQSETADAFDQEDSAAMETLAGQLAAAMRNAVLFRERGEQLANLNALNRVIQTTASALHLDDLLTSLCDVVVELMGPDVFFVALYDEGGQKLVAPFVLDEGVFYRQVEISQKGFVEYMLSSGKPVLIRNMTQEADKYPVEQATIGSRKLAASWLGVPLQAGEQTVGALVVQSYRNYAYDDQDLNFLQAVASQIVVSIEKTRSFEKTEQALDELRRASEQQQRLFDIVRELSTPLVPISEGILVLPLIGTVDSQRAEQIIDVLLSGISQRRARVVIMDITGVPVVDTSVANHLLQATQAVRLLGSECILVGITPEVAQTLVGLGVELEGLITRSDLQAGVDYALKLLGRRIVTLPRRVTLPGGKEKPAAPEEHRPAPAPPSPSR